MPKSAPPREDLLSVAEAADQLEITERQVWNLIKSGKLVTDKTVAEVAGELITEETEKASNRVWISLVEINRYRLIHGKDTRLDHAFSRFPSSATSNFQRRVVFGPWGETGNYPQFELELTIDDWLRLAAKPVTGQAAYETIRAEVRGRLGPGAPENFTVQFKINQADLAETLKEAVYQVVVPNLSLHDNDDMRSMAMEHLLDHSILKIDGVRGDVRDYLKQAVVNFYRDLTDRANPEVAFGGPDEVEAKLIAATHKLSGRKHPKPTADRQSIKQKR